MGIFPGNSEMAKAMRRHDWRDTPLGDPRQWPDALLIPLRMLLTSRFEMWIGWGEDLRFFYNDAYIPTLGIKHPSMLGKPFREVWAEVYEDVADQVELVRQGQATSNQSLLLLLERSGYREETYHSFSYSPLFDAEGLVAGLLCIVNEDTKRVITERRLDTLHQLSVAMAGAHDAHALHRAVQRVFAGNRRDFPFAALRFGDAFADAEEAGLFAKAMAGITHDLNGAGKIIALSPEEEWPCGDWDAPPRDALAVAIAGLDGETPIGTLILGLNPYRPAEPDVLDVARLAAGQIGAALSKAAAFDNERRRADRMWSLSRDLMVVVDRQGIVRAASPSWSRILGRRPDEVIGQPSIAFLHPDDVALSEAALAETLDGQELSSFENRLRAADASYHHVEWHTTAEDGLVYAYGRDVTDRRHVEAALSQSEKQFRYLVQGVTDYAIYMLDLDGMVSSWNEGARRIKGYEPAEIIGAHFSRFYTDEDRAAGEPARTLEIARREGRVVAEGWRVRKDGERFRASVVVDTIRDDEGRPVGFAKITRDITEPERTQRELETARETLFQAQKMEAIGQLTGGVAHDFNNLLTAIIGSLELLRRRLPDDAMSRRLLDNAAQGAQRGATLTQRMLAFARRQELTVDRVDLARLLSGMNDLVQRSIGPEWPISISFPLKLPEVRADANQLEMALLNLIVNARDAMPSGGRILITGACADAAPQGVSDPSGDGYVRLVVRDEGTGMDGETLRRATEPFFTTKGVGKGTGLGLSMVHGMARQIGGTFDLVSAPGEGTSAILWLPIAPPEIAEVAEDAPCEAPASREALTILAVDDDPLVLMNTVALLEDLGHQVLEAHSAPAALELLRRHGHIDLLITDQAMPNMTGTELIAALDQFRPDMPVILASGYGESIHIERQATVRLGKPFGQEQLATALDAVWGYSSTS